MISLLIILIGTIAVCPSEAVECYMCDNEAGIDKCDERTDKNKNDVTCTGSSCSVTSYVRSTATGC